MKKIGKILIIIVFIIFIVGIIIIKLYERHRDNNVNSFTFPETLTANNYTDHRRADTLVMIVLHKIFEIDTANVNIIYTPSRFDNYDFQLIAMINKENYGTHNYTLFVKKSKYFNVKECICHEMIHLYQMEKGDLIPVDREKIVFKGDTIYFNEVPYDVRSYEKEAFEQTLKVKYQLNQYLYY